MVIYSAYLQRAKGGSFRMWVRLLELAALRGHQVIYFADGTIRSLDEAGAEFYRVRRPAGPMGILLFLFRVWRVCRFRVALDSDSTVVISQGVPYSVVLRPLQAKGARMLTVVLGDFEQDWRNRGVRPVLIRLWRVLIRGAVRRSDLICPVSRDLAQRVQRVYHPADERIKIVTNTIPQMRMAGGVTFASSNRPVIMYVGRLSRHKNVDVLLEALRRWKEQRSFHAVLVGSGPERGALEEQVRLSGLSNMVEFTGEVQHASPYIHDADVLVLPSRYEACPTVLMEALGCGTLSIGSRVGGIPDILGNDALLFEAGSARALLDTLNAVIPPESEAADPALIAYWKERASEFSGVWEHEILQLTEALVD